MEKQKTNKNKKNTFQIQFSGITHFSWPKLYFSGKHRVCVILMQHKESSCACIFVVGNLLCTISQKWMDARCSLWFVPWLKRKGFKADKKKSSKPSHWRTWQTLFTAISFYLDSPFFGLSSKSRLEIQSTVSASCPPLCKMKWHWLPWFLALFLFISYLSYVE